MDLRAALLELSQADAIEQMETVQSLWSGYGCIERYRFRGGRLPSLMVKQIQLAGGTQHPRGWNSAFAHQRKLKSYQVEMRWYTDYAHRLPAEVRIPELLGHLHTEDQIVLILEDLDAAGFAGRVQQPNAQQLQACIEWLAGLHACFLGKDAQGLWHPGTYWHLATRPDELKRLAHLDPDLWAVAQALDQQLQSAGFRTLVHGDAKLANFCFAQQADAVAALDFQYIGSGCGVQDLVYLLGGCLDQTALTAHADHLVDAYFSALHQACAQQQIRVDGAALEAEWRRLYPIAWADFQRFLKGWCPQHTKLNVYSEQMTQIAIQSLRHS